MHFEQLSLFFQLLSTEDTSELHIVQNSLMILFRRDTTGSIMGIFSQVKTITFSENIYLNLNFYSRLAIMSLQTLEGGLRFSRSFGTHRLTQISCYFHIMITDLFYLPLPFHLSCLTLNTFIVLQVHNGEDAVRDRALRFLHTKLKTGSIEVGKEAQAQIVAEVKKAFTSVRLLKNALLNKIMKEDSSIDDFLTNDTLIDD